MPLENSITLSNMIFDADPVVKVVMLLLFCASVVCWAIIIEKVIVLRRTRKSLHAFNLLSREFSGQSDIFPDFTRHIVESGVAESKDVAGNETRADYRERVERTMRMVLSIQLTKVGMRTSILATVGSISPFVGLFGTVWGIMHSFIGIAGSGETSLTVVAPGIAEALLATAMGLVAAVPAIIAYNKINDSVKNITKEGIIGISIIGNYLAKERFSE